jgi:hypothetical protein
MKKTGGTVFRRAAWVLAALLVSCPQGGPGLSVPDPVLIASAADLAKIGGGYPLNGNYRLDADITLVNWTPIGGGGKPFTGCFDGNGHAITLESFSAAVLSAPGAKYLGVFGYTGGAAEIRNVSVHSAISQTITTGAACYAGGVAGYGANGTVITNCSTSGSVRVASGGFQSGAGGVIGYVTGAASEISRCSASGDITMTGLHQQEFAGGIAGYSGGGARISKCRYTGGTVQSAGADSQYPYAGGISGYNYGGAVIGECYSSGTVRAEGTLIPYAGGIAGYTSGGAATVKNSYSTMTVVAVSRGRTALAGGVTAATANMGKTSTCYAAGTVSVTVNGQGSAGDGAGIAAAANAGGISGSVYYGTASTVEYCVALNPSVTGTDSSGGAVFNIHRVAGAGTGGTGVWTDNYAWSGMTLSAGGTPLTPADTGPNGRDGGDCAARPDQSVYAGLGWDFAAVWEMGSGGCPVLRWQN